MKKIAFTLIEIICTVVILCLLFLFITPKLSGLINRNEEQLKKQMEVKIIDAAKEYVTSYDKTFTSNLREGDTKNINLSVLINAGLIDEKELTDADISLNGYVVVSINENDKLVYTVVQNSD